MAKPKRAALSLGAVCAALDKTRAKYRLEGVRVGSPTGARVLTTELVVKGIVTLGFRHPTKKATRGRYAFLHTTTTALAEALR